MESLSHFQTWIEKFSGITERYGDEYPLLFYEPNILSKEKIDLMNRNNSIHLFSESGDAFKFAQSLGISFILILPNDYDENELMQEFGELKNTYKRRMLNFEEERFFNDISDKIIKSLKAYVFCTLVDCLAECEMKEDEEEIMTMCDIQDIAKDFRQEFILIWFDPQGNLESKQKLEEKIEIKIEEKNTYIEFSEFQERLKNYSGTPYHLIMSGSDKAENIVKEISQHKDLLGLYIYCKDFEKNQNIENEKVEIKSTIEELIPRIKEGIRTRSKLNNSFPAFATNFDTSDRSGIYKLHYYLSGLIIFKNRKQAKESFITLARKIYQDEEKELDRFEGQYNEYNKEDILRWYTKESPIYRLINNCLRISSADSILYCRLILKDLERAIREQYQEESKSFNGLVYRGASISNEEWEKLQKNIGQEIEMYGFLSTTVSQKTAINFLKADLKNKILIQIIVPPLPEEDEQGFADISKFSEFQKEQEILFNVRSNFRILEAGVSKVDNQNIECRQLVLLYGAQSLKRYTTKNKPSISLQLELPPEVKCNLCGSVKKLFGFKQQEETFVNCLGCLIKGSMPKDTPLISLDGEKEKRIERPLLGKILTYKDKITFANCGYKCRYCKAKGKEKYYKWISCKGNNTLIQCSECLEKKKIIENKVLILEASPYSMWQEGQEKWETISSDYQVDISQRIGLEDPGLVYLATDNHRESLKYTKKMFEKVLKRRRREIFKSGIFGMFGEAFLQLGEYQQAFKCFSHTLGLHKFIGQEKSPPGVDLYLKLGVIQNNLSKYKEALESFNRALDLRVYKELHPTTASLYHGIALAYQSLREHEKALDFFTKALDILKSVEGEKHPSTAGVYHNLGLFYHSLEKNQDALKYLKLALEIYESVFGEKDSSTAASYANLASLYMDLRDYQKAIKLLNKALDIQKSIHKAEHPTIAACYNNLANVYRLLGKNQEAKEYLEKNLDITKSFYGEKHSRTISGLNNLGLVCQNLGDYQKALEYFQKALDHRKSLFGEKHADIAISYSNFGSVYLSLRKHQKALEYFQKALDLQNTIFEGPQQNKANSLKNIAAVYEKLDQYQKALDYHENALQMKISVHGEKHSETLMSYNYIGIVYGKLGQHQKALNYYKKAFEIKKLIFEEVSPETALCYHNLASSYEKLGEVQHTLEYYTKALRIQKSLHEGDHPDTVTTFNNLGAMFMRFGEWKKAKKYLKEALRMRISLLTENHPDLAGLYLNLGILYTDLKKSQKALKYYSKAVTLVEAADGENPSLTAKVYDNIGLLYRALENCQEAFNYLRKSLEIRRKIYGENHAVVAVSYFHIGLCYLAFSEYQNARDNFLKAVEILESLHEEKHPDLHYKSYHNFHSVYSKLEDQKKAEECLAKAYSISESEHRM